ncbi:MAG: glutaminyl-peptide cyclotransferase [Hyphomonadaceae bacterium]
MRILAGLAFLAASACSPGGPPVVDTPAAPVTPAYSFEVAATYPHDPKAFTEGLLIQDGQLYESTGMEGTSWVRKVDLQTGAVQQQYDVDKQYFGEGIVVWDDRIITLTWRGQKGFILDRATLAPKGEWTYGGEGWSLTRDDKQIFMSDGTSQIRKLDPVTLKETGRIDVKLNGRPIDQINELEFIKGEIWANIFQTDRIVRIDPATGNVVGVVYLGGIMPLEERRKVDVLNGIAYDKATDKIYVTGKYWPKLFEITIKDPANAKPQ